MGSEIIDRDPFVQEAAAHDGGGFSALSTGDPAHPAGACKTEICSEKFVIGSKPSDPNWCDGSGNELLRAPRTDGYGDGTGNVFQGVRAIDNKAETSSTLDRKNQKYDAKYSGGAQGAIAAPLGDCSHQCYHDMHQAANQVNNARNHYGAAGVFNSNSNGAAHAVCNAGFSSGTCGAAHQKLKVHTPGFDKIPEVKSH